MILSLEGSVALIIGAGDGIGEAICTALPGRMADPAEIAAAARFLASGGSSHMRGRELVVDGGYTAR